MPLQVAERFERPRSARTLDLDCAQLPRGTQSRLQFLDQLEFTLGLPKRNMQTNSESNGVDVFDPHGDLRLLVGEHGVAFQVCSRALARSSPVWENMLYGPFAEGKAQQDGGDWEILLPEDRPRGLRILCHVAHGKFDDLPQAIAHNELLYLTVLADKYDMTSLLKPFWSNWLGNPDRVAESAAGDLVDYLSVCHKLGYGLGFHKAFVYLATRTATYDDGQLYIDGFEDYNLYVDDQPWLLDILGTASPC